MIETSHRLQSRHLGNERTIWIQKPENECRSILVFLDAELYRDRVGIEEVIQELQSDEESESTLFVFVSMHSVAARWIECECHVPFVQFIDEELLPWVEDMFPPSRAVKNRVIAGLSYSGLAAAFVALKAPFRFTRVIAQSGSFWWNDCWIINEVGRIESKALAEFYLDVGSKEIQENVRHKEDVLQVVSQIEGVRRFRDALRMRGHEVNYSEFDGGHEFAAWRKALPDALRWALRHSV